MITVSDLKNPLTNEWLRALREGDKVLPDGQYVTPQLVRRAFHHESGGVVVLEACDSRYVPPFCDVPYTDTPRDGDYPPITRLPENYFNRRDVA